MQLIKAEDLQNKTITELKAQAYDVMGVFEIARANLQTINLAIQAENKSTTPQPAS